MHISKDQRLDAISGRDQMAEKPPTEEAADASGHRHATAYWDIWQGRRRKGTRLIQGEEIGHGAGSENRERTEEGIPPEL